MSISTCALREEGDPAIIKITASHSGFLSTPSARRATDRQKHSSRTFTISIHALREEGDPIPTPRRGESNQFLSTPSARRATPKAVKASVTMSISIHALREEGDRRLGAAAQVGEGISIHALREEGDAGPAFPRCRPAISIHALREEGDAAKSMWNAQPAEFLSTPSARRATDNLFSTPHKPVISIHALREEGDTMFSSMRFLCIHFYPRPPRGGRPTISSASSAPRNFYPRPPRGGRPGLPPSGQRLLQISIHALREEGDAEQDLQDWR